MNAETLAHRDWSPFVLAEAGKHADAPRSINTPEGIADRLRAAAFAEVQARDAFNWAADRFEDAPEDLRRAWRTLAHAEERHLQWLLTRMQELGVEIGARKVSDFLWQSLIQCKTARDFAIYIASAEERGRKAGVRFHEAMAKSDPVSSAIFGKIAEEEVSHIELALRFYPDGAVKIGT